jgi:hypothetical protein
MGATEELRRYDEHSAAVLIGLSLQDIHRLAQQVGLGQKVSSNGSEHLMFSYPELLELSLMAARNNP